MEGALQAIGRLAGSQRLIPAEQVIMSAVQDLGPFLVPGITEESLSNVQAHLIGLFSANEGRFSVQCALFIASKLLTTYKLSESPRIWDLFTLAITKTNTSTLMAVGYICRHIGTRFKAQLPRLTEHALRQRPELDYPVAYCLRGVFKSKSAALGDYIPQTLEFARRAISQARQATSVAVVKLLKVLVSYRGVNMQRVFDCVRVLLKNDPIPFVKNEVAMLIARAGFEPSFADQAREVESDDGNEWTIEKGEEEEERMTNALNVIVMFPQVLSMTFPHFMNLLTPTICKKYHGCLYGFVRKNCEDMIEELVPMLPSDIRYTYFTDVSEEPVSTQQLKILSVLCPGDESIGVVARVATRLACSGDERSFDTALDFFEAFAKSRPSAAMPYMRSAFVFLSQPVVDDDDNGISDITGQLAVAHAIIANLPTVDEMITPHENVVREFMMDVFEHDGPHSPRFAGAFRILSVLPEKFGVSEMVKNAWEMGVKSLRATEHTMVAHELADSLLAFRAKHFGDGDLARLIAFAVARPGIPVLSSVADLSVLAPLSMSISRELVSLILKSAFSVSPTSETLRYFVKRTLPTGFDVLKISVSVSSKKRREQNALISIIESCHVLIPTLVEGDRQYVYDTLMRGQSVSSTAHLMLLALCRSPFPMPKDTLSLLLKLLETNNISQLEIVSECIAHLCAKVPSAMGTVFAFVERNSSKSSSCVLLSSLFSHVNVPGSYMMRAIAVMNAAMKSGGMVPFAVHAMSSMLLTHSVHVSSFAGSQMDLLFQTLHTTISMQPVSLKLCVECLKLLVEEVSSSLIDRASPLVRLVTLMLRTVELTPVSYAREMYFECNTSLVTFARPLSDVSSLQFPMFLSARTTLQLAACEMFSNALKFERLHFPVVDLMDRLLRLLQRTSDARVSLFIAALAQASHTDMMFWVASVRRILSENLLFHDHSIEPSPGVKICFLTVAELMLPKLADNMTMSTENLDDIITSASRSTETDHIQLQEAAFPILKLAIDLFRGRTCETGDRLLDIYNSQFSQAVQTGFKLNLGISGGFLSTYLTFLTERVKRDEYADTLSGYLLGLSECKQRTASFYALATHLCGVAMKWKDHSMIPFLKGIAPAFEECVVQAMHLWRDSSDWRAMNRFRTLASQFYVDLLPSFIWLQTFAPAGTHIDVYVAFCITEAVGGSEPWIVQAGSDALMTAIEYFGSQICVDLMVLIIKIAQKRPDLLTSFADGCARALQPSPAYDAVREMLLSCALRSTCPMPAVIAYALDTDIGRHLSKYAFAISNWMIESFTRSRVSAETATAMFSVLFNHTPTVIGAVIAALVELEPVHLEFVMVVIGIGLPRVRGEIPLAALSRFCVAHFKRGGMTLVGQILLSDQELGLALLSGGAAKAAFLLCANDVTNARAYLRFIQVCLSASAGFAVADQFAFSVTRLSLQLIRAFGSDVQFGHQIVSLCMQIIVSAEEIVGAGSFQEAYSRMDRDTKGDVIDVLTKQVAKSALRQKNAKLAVFSTGVRARRGDVDDNEWGDLEISD